MKYIIAFCVFTLGIAVMIGSFGCSANNPATSTTTSLSSTTTTCPSCAKIRLYYTYPTNPSKGVVKLLKGYDSQNFGSAYSSDGVNFTQDSGARLGPLPNLSDPDVFKESNSIWTMFYSKAVSSDPSEQYRLYKATSSAASGTFTDIGSFVGNLGNISSSIKVGSIWYVYVCSTTEGIVVCSYEAGGSSLHYIKTAVSGGVDPSVIKLGSGGYKMYYKSSGNTYCMDSSDGLSWSNSKLIVSKAEVPGAIYVDGSIYLYYTNGDSSDPSTAGKVLVKISTDGGATFGSAQVATGLGDAACDADPVLYE